MLVALVYLPALSAGYVWDDRGLVLANDVLRHPTWDGVFRCDLWCGVPGARSPYFRPAMTLSLLLDEALGGGPRVAHAQSLAWHLVAVFLVARLAATRLGGWAPLAVAAWWGLHPLNSEAVVWISARNDPMAAVFVLGALLAALAERPWAAFGCAAVGLLAKESAILALPAYLLWQLGHRAPVRPRIVVALAAGVAAALVLRSVADLGPIPRLDGAAAWTPDRIAAVSLRVLSWPAIPWPLLSTVSSTTSASPGVVVGALSTLGLLVALARSRRGACLVLLALLPILATLASLRAVGLVGERYLYLPLVFLGVAGGAPPRWVRLPIAALLATYVALLEARLPDWRSEVSLFRGATERQPDAYAEHLLAGALLRSGDAAGAGKAWDHALTASPPAREACRPSVELARALLPARAFLARLPVWKAICAPMVDELVAEHLVALGRWSEAGDWASAYTPAASTALALAEGDLLGAAAIDHGDPAPPALRDRVASLLLASGTASETVDGAGAVR